MSTTLLASVVFGYFLILILVSRLTGKKDENSSFFLGNRTTHWGIIAFGMVGASLSGVTFISVPGWVGASHFSYMQMVLGYIVGYVLIATVLLPMYYKLQLTSIYTYLNGRFGNSTYKTGASYFLVSRIIGSAFRLFLVAIVLEQFVFKGSLDFIWIVLITIGLIWVYTAKGGMSTIIWTDALQTICMLAAVGLSFYAISSELGLSVGDAVFKIKNSEYSQWFYCGEDAGTKHFISQFLSGAAIALVMTGLDQDMMQKNLACKNLKDAQKNVISLSIVLVFVNLLFLCLGALLYIYADETAMVLPEKADLMFPTIALESGLGVAIGLFFIIGLIASAYSSADSALTALTTSFYVDILDSRGKDEAEKKSIRRKVHIGMSVVLALVIWLFKLINDESVIKELFTIAGYTYGPLLGLYAFGLFTKFKVKDRWVPLVCIAAPAVCWALKSYVYPLGFELLLVNGALTFIGLSMLMTGERVNVKDLKGA